MPRPKGSKNKMGAEARENVMAVFTRLGGTHRMASWAEDNLTEFYRLYAKLIPTESKTDLSGNINLQWPLSQSPLDK